MWLPVSRATSSPWHPTKPPGAGSSSPSRCILHRAWKLCGDGSAHTICCLPSDPSFAIRLYPTKRQLTPDCKAFLTCASRLIDEHLTPSGTRTEVSRGARTTGPGCGHRLEGVVSGHARVPAYSLQGSCPMQDGRVVVTTYYHARQEVIAEE